MCPAEEKFPALIVLKVIQVPRHLAGGVTPTQVDILKDTVPEDMGMANVSTEVSHGDADKVHFYWTQPVFPESLPCSSLALMPACLLPRTFDLDYPESAIYDCLSAVVAQ